MILLLLILNLWAEPIAVQSLKSSDFEFETYLNNQPQVKSWIQYYKNQNKVARQSLYRELKKAQFEFISGDLEKSKKYFKNISDLKFQFDWNEEERKVIHFALLRLAQVTQEPLVKNQLLTEAIEFDSSLVMDENLFPPPMVEKFKQLKKISKTQVWSLPKNAAEFDEILVNGKSHKGHTSFLRSAAARLRLTFLSNKYQTITLIQEPQHLESANLVLKPMALGDCDHPNWQMELDSSQQWLFVDEGCVGESKNPQTLSTVSAQNLEISASNQNSSGSVPQILKSKWLWIGVSILAAGVVVSQNQKQSPQAQSKEVQVFRNN